MFEINPNEIQPIGSGKSVKRVVENTLENNSNSNEINRFMKNAEIYYQEHLDDLDDYVKRSKLPYPMTRTLEEGESPYVKFLPELYKRNKEGKITPETESFIQVVDDLIKERKEEAETSKAEYTPPVIMDLGPGNFQALLDAREKWGDDVILVGLGPDKLLDFDGIDSTDKKIDATRQAVEDANINVIPDSLVKIESVVPNNLQPDVILSCNAMQYTNTPLWETFSEVYRTLKPNGHAFIAFMPPHLSSGSSIFAETGDHFAHSDVKNAMNKRYHEDLGRLQEYLRSQGHHFDINPEKGYLSCKKVEVNGSYELPSGIHTIVRPTVKDLGLEESQNTRVAFWSENMAEEHPHVLSAYPVMHIPE